MMQPLTDDVREVLARATVAGNRITLPHSQLDRKLYMAVNKVLEVLGGTWDRKRKAHIFPGDITETFEETLTHGLQRKQTPEQELQAFYTPSALAVQLVNDHLDIRPGDAVLEPSAGHGAFALATARYTDVQHVTCYEIDPAAVAVLRGLGFPTTQQDFLTVLPMPRFDWVVMNPPFKKGQDMQHVLHALGFVRAGGGLMAITSCMAGEGKTRLHYTFAETMRCHKAERSLMGARSFRQSGTDVQTTRWVVRKN